MASAPPIGEVGVEVYANLARLLSGFKDGASAAKRFDDVLEASVSGAAKKAEAATASLGKAEERLGTSLNATADAANRYGQALSRAADMATRTAEASTAKLVETENRLAAALATVEKAAQAHAAALDQQLAQGTQHATQTAEALNAAQADLARALGQSTAASQKQGAAARVAGAETVAATEASESALTSLRRTLMSSASVIAAGFGLNELKNLADGYTTFTNQLKVAGLAGQDLANTQEALYGIAQKYGVQLEAIGTLYGRVSQAGKELGANQSDLIKFTNGVGAALKVQGGSAEESRGALLQLSQMLGDTKVQAQEYNSVNDGARPILQAVANGIDKYAGSIAKLRADVIAGNVTSKEFFQGFLRGSAQLEQQATQSNLTIGASFTVLNNALGRYVGQTDQSLSATQRVSAGIAALANNLDVIVPILAAIGTALATKYTAEIIKATIATVAKSAADVRATLTTNALAAAGVRLNAVMSVGVAEAVSITAGITGMEVAMGVAAGAAGALGKGMLAAFGGEIGIAILAVAGAVYLYYQHVEQTTKAIATFNDHHQQLNKLLGDEEAKANAAALQIRNLGKDHETATGYVRAFAGATGDAADALHRQAEEAKNARLESLKLAALNAANDRAASTGRLQQLYIQSGVGAMRADPNGPGGLANPASVYGESQANRLINPSARRGINEEISRYNQADADYGRAVQGYGQSAANPLESYLGPNTKTQGRDIGAEIEALQKQLVAAEKAGNEGAEREILKEIKLRQKINEYLTQGLSFEVASATANAEALGTAKKASDKITFTAEDADKALAGIGAKITSGARTVEKQQQLYDDYKAGKGPLAAPPGRSYHNTDQARDIAKTPGMSLNTIRQAIEGAGGKILELIDEGNHFHVAWAKDAKSQADTADAQVKQQQEFKDQLAKYDGDISQARQGQAIDAAIAAKEEKDRINAERNKDKTDIEARRQHGDLTDPDAKILDEKNEQLRTLQLQGVDLKEQERTEKDATKLREQTQQAALEALQAQEDLAKTVGERRMKEREILKAEEDFERANLQATIKSKFTSPTDRTIAQGQLNSLDTRYGPKRNKLDRESMDDLLGTAPDNSRFSLTDQITGINNGAADRKSRVQDAAQAGIEQAKNDPTKNLEQQQAAIEKILKESAARQVEIEKDRIQQIKDAEDAQAEMRLQQAGSVADSLTSIAENLAGKQSAVYKTMFAVSKAFAIADSSVQLANALVKALNTPFPANLAAIATVAASGASIISNLVAIKATFDTGGWTGDMGPTQAAGIVHGQEFVVKAGPAAQHRDILETMNAGRDPTAALRASAAGASAANGGNGLMGGGGSRPLNVTLENHAPGVEHEVQRGATHDEVKIIARKVLHDEGPSVIASDMGRQNSRTSKAIQRTTTARPRRK